MPVELFISGNSLVRATKELVQVGVNTWTVISQQESVNAPTDNCLLNVIKLTVISPQFSVGSLESHTGNC